MKTEVLSGIRAKEALSNPAFQEEWRRLEAACPWATVYQTWAFVSAWYESYASVFQPLIICGRDEQNGLVGLLPLAQPVEGGPAVIAGTYHSEYQAWLAQPHVGDEFIESAISSLADFQRGGALLFTYLPPGAPRGWLEPGRRWAGMSDHLRLPRPLAAMGDGSSFKQSLKKKGNKSKISRLEKAGGKLRLEQVTEPDRLAAWFEDIERFGTIRIGALRNAEALNVDPAKKPFYQRLLAQTRLLHVTLLWAGDQLLSAHVGVRDGENVVLTIFTHSPFHARHSPGKLHLLLLGVMLAEEGVTALDLTPTGDYKDRFATHHDEVGRLQIFLTAGARRRFKAGLALRTAAKNLLRRSGKDPEEAKAVFKRWIARARRARLRDLPAALGRRIKLAGGYTRELRIYHLNAGEVGQEQVPALMARDRLADLLVYHPVTASEPSREEFLRECLSRLEEGQHIYTLAEADQLSHYGWLIDRQEQSFMSEVGQILQFPPDSAVLFGYYSAIAARGRGLYQASLRQMLADAARIPGTRHIWISVLANNGASRHVIEKIGFQYRFSFFEQKRFGAVRRWTDAPAEFVAAIPPRPAESPVALSSVAEE